LQQLKLKRLYQSMSSLPAYSGHLSYEQNEKRKEENRQKNAADIPELLSPSAAHNELDRDEPYTSNGIFGGLYDQDKVTAKTKKRKLNLMRSPRRRRVRKILDYDIRKYESSESENESESESEQEVVCPDPPKKTDSSVPLASPPLPVSPIVFPFDEQFKQIGIIQQSLELNGLIGHVLHQARNLNMALRGCNAINDQVLQQRGWTAPEDQLIFLQEVNGVAFSSLFGNSAQAPVISQGLETQNRILIELLKDLIQANNRFLSFVQENESI